MRLAVGALGASLLAASLLAQSFPARPKTLGVAHMAVYVSDLANLFDPDGTRVELMEPVTIDGKPAPSSTAQPPKKLPGQ